MIDRQPHLLTPYQKELLAQLSAMAMHEISHLRQARLCGLTGVLTRQALLTEGEALLQRARTAGATPVLVSVVLIGLRPCNAEPDGARLVDDRLRRIAALCQAQTGTRGLVGRSGSGEFSLIWEDDSQLEQRISALRRDLQAVAPPPQLRLVATAAEPSTTNLRRLMERAAAGLG